MIRKLLILSLCAVPALAFGQEAKKPAACHTLEAAGGFLGPDEIIVNGLVCPRGTATDDAQESTKSVPGVVTTDSSTINVVAAAKAANQRVAAAENAIKQKAAAEQEQNQPTPDATPILTAAAPEQQQQQSSSAPAAAAPQNTDSKKADAASASSAPEAITDPVVNDAIGSFSDAMEKLTSRDPQPATESEPTLSAQKNPAHVSAETQPCAKNSASSAKCVDMIGQVAEDLGHL